MNARFVALEGGEGCGKSTQASRLAAVIGAVATREPGGTPVGERLRELLLDPATGRVDPRAEALMMAADRAQHVAEVIRPALGAGRHVVSDRYIWSSLAYQGAGRGLDPEELHHLSTWATDGLRPDLVVLLDVDPVLASTRLAADRDRFEREDPAFHERVREGFLALASAEPDRSVVVDASGSVGEVASAVLAAVRDRLQLAV